MDKRKEGELYRVITVANTRFEIRYGFYAEIERLHWDPMPIFPDFKETPCYTEDGYGFASADQEICEHFKPRPRVSSEGWCNDCTHFEVGEEFIGICRCEKRKKPPLAHGAPNSS